MFYNGQIDDIDCFIEKIICDVLYVVKGCYGLCKDQIDGYTTSMITPMMGVAEGEHKYGADAFEEFMANQGDNGKYPVYVAPVKKDGKSR